MPASLLQLLRAKRSQLFVAARLVPRFRRCELTTPEAVINLPGEIVSGHADRHVVRVTLGPTSRPMPAFLKREHRVRWRDRLNSWMQGMGFATLSAREARVLAILQRLGVPVPRVLACGETGGRAFLLLKAVSGSTDLRRFLHRMGAAVPLHRRVTAASKLGAILGRLHGAGYEIPDLLSKHVLIHMRTLAITLVDCPRVRRLHYVSPARAARDLGRLDASLAEGLATPRDRLCCLRAYWRTRSGAAFSPFGDFVKTCGKAARRSQRRRSVRELRRPPVDESGQQLRWLDGENLCVTRVFWQACRGNVPTWLSAMSRSRVRRPQVDPVFWNSRRLIMLRWPAASVWRRGLARMFGWHVVTNWTRRAGALFRLRRHGVGGPRVLAFGRRPDGSGFLLVRPTAESTPIGEWLAGSHGQRGAVLRRAGTLIRRVHDTGERIGFSREPLHVSSGGRVTLAPDAELRPMPRPAGRWPMRDLAQVLRGLKLDTDDAAQLVRHYLGGTASVADGRRLATDLRGGLPTDRSAHHV